MSSRVPEADAVLRDIVAARAGGDGMSVKRMFGSDALMVEGRIACFVTGAGRLVAKLPQEIADPHLQAGLAEPMAMGGRRPMHGWFSFALDDEVDWWALADRAVAHVRALDAGATREADRARG